MQRCSIFLHKNYQSDFLAALIYNLTCKTFFYLTS